jgi:hypothetical protein
MRYMASGAKLTTAFARRGLIAEHGIAWSDCEFCTPIKKAQDIRELDRMDFPNSKRVRGNA